MDTLVPADTEQECSMSFNWRALPGEELEQHFNPRVACPDVEQHLARYAALSAEARRGLPGRYDIRYGERPKETLDVHEPDDRHSARPLVLFIHGGYWRALDKSDHSFVVPSVLDTGAVVANINYDLCPTVTLDVIVEETARAVRFCHANAAKWGADPGAMVLMGHSAGAHLAAAMLQRRWRHDELAPGAIRGVAALTGVYEPQVILGVSVNEEAQIDADTAARHDCLARTFILKPPVVLAVGGDEPEGWIAQTTDFAAHCRGAGLDTREQVLPGGNHFTVLDRAVDPADDLYRVVTGLWR